MTLLQPPRCPEGFQRDDPDCNGSSPGAGRSGDGCPLHGLSAFGELKYPKDFTHFDYANPDAPKGGTFAFSPPNWLFNQSPQTFNTLNTFSAKGDAPPRMELCYDTLMASALDEPDSDLWAGGGDRDRLRRPQLVHHSNCGRKQDFMMVRP